MEGDPFVCGKRGRWMEGKEGNTGISSECGKRRRWERGEDGLESWWNKRGYLRRGRGGGGEGEGAAGAAEGGKWVCEGTGRGWGGQGKGWVGLLVSHTGTSSERPWMVSNFLWSVLWSA